MLRQPATQSRLRRNLCPRKLRNTTKRQQNTPRMLLDTTQKRPNTTTPAVTRRRPTMRIQHMGMPLMLDITPKRPRGRTRRSTARSNVNLPWRRRRSWGYHDKNGRPSGEEGDRLCRSRMEGDVQSGFDDAIMDAKSCRVAKPSIFKTVTNRSFAQPRSDIFAKMRYAIYLVHRLIRALGTCSRTAQNMDRSRTCSIGSSVYIEESRRVTRCPSNTPHTTASTDNKRPALNGRSPPRAMCALILVR